MTRDLLLVRFGKPNRPTDPAAGLHYQLGGTVGLLVPPVAPTPGKCWWCGETRRADVPLCRECREIAWGEGDVRVTVAKQGDI